MKVLPKAKASPNCKGKSHGKELDAAEQVLLKITQLKGHLADPLQIGSVTSKRFESIKSQLMARLTPDLLRIYSAEYQGSNTSMPRGMVLLDKLQEAQKQMDLIHVALPCITGNFASSPLPAASHQEAVKRVLDAGISLSDVVHSSLALCFLDEARASGDWHVYSKAIAGLGERVPEVPLNNRMELVRDHALGFVAQLCKIDIEESTSLARNIADVCAIVWEGLAGEEHRLLQNELDDLAKFSRVHDDMSEEDCVRAEQARDSLAKNKQSFFYKSLTLLPGGRVGRETSWQSNGPSAP
jgi:hypothetical protein